MVSHGSCLLRNAHSPFAQELQRGKPGLFKLYLHTYNSIPMFLSEVNRFLFESTTVCQGN